jgi:hypothetical protein
MKNALFLLVALSLVGAGCVPTPQDQTTVSQKTVEPSPVLVEKDVAVMPTKTEVDPKPYSFKFTSDSAREKTFATFLKNYFRASDEKDLPFLRKVFPTEYLELNGGNTEENFTQKVEDLSNERIRPGEITIKCAETYCDATNYKALNGLRFGLDGNQWVGYDVDTIRRQRQVKEALKDSAYTYQLSFTGWGPVTYDVRLNGKPIQELKNYSNGTALNFLLTDATMGKNTLSISAKVNQSESRYNEKEYQKGTLEASYSFTVQRYQKDNSDPYAAFDDSSKVIESGDPDDIFPKETFIVTKQGYTKDFSFTIK